MMPSDQTTRRPDDQTDLTRATERRDIMDKIRELELLVQKKDEEISKLRHANEGLSRVTETLLETNKKLTLD